MNYNEWLKTLTYKQLKNEKIRIIQSLNKFGRMDTKAIISLDLATSLIEKKQKEHNTK